MSVRKFTRVCTRVCTRIRSFQYISDLHLEQRSKLVPIPVISKNMILAGDIGDPFDELYKEYLEFCSNEYENTFLVTGNHEYWNTNVNDLSQVDEQIENVVDKLDNVHFLKNGVVETDNVYFIGCTLWSKINKPPARLIGDELNIKYDGRLITWNELNELHEKDVNWISDTIKQCQDKHIVVATHHLPTFKLLHCKYKKSYLNYHDRYYTNLEHLIQKPILAWIGGHSHCNMKIDVNGVFLSIAAFGNPNNYEKYYLQHKVVSFNIPTTLPRA